MKTIAETIKKWNELYDAAEGNNPNEKMQSIITTLTEQSKNSEYIFYVYKGEVGILCYLDKDIANEKGYENDGQIVFVPAYDMAESCKDIADEHCCGTYEDSYDEYGGCMSIDLHTVVNIENEQCLVCVWVSDEYADSDEYQRELCTETDRYYDWTSERTRMIDNIIDAMDEEKDLSELENEWCEKVSQYKDPLGFDYHDKAQFSSVLSDALAASGREGYGTYKKQS